MRIAATCARSCSNCMHGLCSTRSTYRVTATGTPPRSVLRPALPPAHVDALGAACSSSNCMHSRVPTAAHVQQPPAQQPPTAAAAAHNNNRSLDSSYTCTSSCPCTRSRTAAAATCAFATHYWPCPLTDRPVSPSSGRSSPHLFEHQFPSWFIRAERFLKSQRQDNNTLWAHASGDLPQPPSPPALGAEPDETAQARFDKAHTARSVWQLLDTTVCIALASLLHETEESHFSQVRFAKDLIVAIKTHYSTPTSASLGRLFLQFLFPDLGMFDRAADLITHLRSLDVNYRAACTEARLALIPCPWRSLFTSSPQASLIALHLSDIESNIRSIASASRAVIPPLFQGCTVPQLPTFTASLASTASLSTVETVAVSIVGERFRVKGGKRGGKGDDASGGGGSSGGPSDTSASGGGSTESGTWPARPTGGGVGAASWYTAQRLTECYIAYFV
ncbi:unnamed protein product [Closterium sp. NIES-53]